MWKFGVLRWGGVGLIFVSLLAWFILILVFCVAVSTQPCCDIFAILHHHGCAFVVFSSVAFLKIEQRFLRVAGLYSRLLFDRVV